MNESSKSVVILMADDDEEDRMLARDALREARLANDLRFVTNGEELMAYLRHQGPFAAPGAAPAPGLILLDLKMPKKNGYEVLQDIRSDPALRRIPVVALTTSKSEEDIARTYDLGVNSFIIKPVTFDGLVETMRILGRYWFSLVELPSQPEGA